MILRARQYEFRFPRPTLILGVLNVTPDSFSDGGRYLDPGHAAEHAHRLVEEGADVVDIGGESTRPGALPVEEAEELRRVLPVIARLSGSLKAPISIDTLKLGVARAALDAGASLVNDVGSGLDRAAMWRLLAETGAGYVCMHMQGCPATMQERPAYRDVVGEVRSFLADHLTQMSQAGVCPEQVALDVGIGFGKTREHNLKLLASLRSFADLRRPLMLGLSRKSLIGQVTGAAVEERLPGSLAGAVLAVEAGVHLLRVHDVAATVQAVRFTEAILGQRESSG